MTASMGRRVVRGTAWVAAARMSVRAIGLVSTVILARLLTPEDFGLVAVASGFLGVLDAMSQFGFNAALIRFQDATDDDYNTAWTLNVLRGSAVCALLLALASPFAGFMGDPRLALLVSALALMPLIGGFENPRFVDFEKDLRFGPMFLLMTSVKVLAFTATVTVALVWRSYWALIIGSLVSEFSRVAISYALRPHLPRVRFSAFRRLFGFSGWLAAGNILGALQQRGDALILQKVLNTSSAGVFYVAKELTMTLFSEMALPLRRVMFPALSQLGAGSEAFRRAYFQSVAALAAVLLPATVGISLVAGDMVPVVLGEQWHDSVHPVQMIGLLLAFKTLGFQGPAVAMAAGRTRLLFTRGVVWIPVALLIFFLGARHYGMDGAVTAYVIGGIVLSLMDMSFASAVLGDGLLAHLRNAWRSIASVGLMALAVWLLQWLVPWPALLPEPLVPILRLAACVAAGALAYTAAHLGLWQACGRPAGPESQVLGLLGSVGARLGLKAGAG